MCTYIYIYIHIYLYIYIYSPHWMVSLGWSLGMFRHRMWMPQFKAALQLFFAMSLTCRFRFLISQDIAGKIGKPAWAEDNMSLILRVGPKMTLGWSKCGSPIIGWLILNSIDLNLGSPRSSFWPKATWVSQFSLGSAFLEVLLRRRQRSEKCLCLWEVRP